MSLVGTIRVRCPGCGVDHDCELVQSLNTRQDPARKQRLLRGELNLLACACGRRVQLAANFLYCDPDADYLCQVCPGGEPAMEQAAAAFRASGATGTQRLVPSLNALIEKVKLLDAGLSDWIIEMLKVLLLSTLGEKDLERVVLFEAVDREAGRLTWAVIDLVEKKTELLTSPFLSYERLAAQLPAAPRGELRIDRLWAVEAVREMIANAN